MSWMRRKMNPPTAPMYRHTVISQSEEGGQFRQGRKTVIRNSSVALAGLVTFQKHHLEASLFWDEEASNAACYQQNKLR
jgi:hypothetical protein